MMDTRKVDDAATKLQYSLLAGVSSEAHLLAAGSVISRADYDAVVTERSVELLCGYPTCPNPLPSDRPRKGRSRISLKDHKVYDLSDSYLFCSSSCLVHSKAFAGTLHQDRCLVANPQKLDEIMRMFRDVNVQEALEGDLGMPQLRIQENVEPKPGEVVSFDEWRGSSDSIEGYVPRRDRNADRPKGKGKAASKAKNSKLSFGENSILSEVHSTGPVIVGDEYIISKTPSGSKGKETAEEGFKADHNQANNNIGFTSTIIVGEEYANLKASPASAASNRKLKSSSRKGAGKGISLSKVKGLKDQLSTLETPSTSSPSQSICNVYASAEGGGSCAEKQVRSSETVLKPSLKSAHSKKLSHSVSWADEKNDSSRGGDLCEIREIEDTKFSPFFSFAGAGEKCDNTLSRNLSKVTEKGTDNVQVPVESVSLDTGNDAGEDEDKMLLMASAEACAMALTKAAEAVASGESDPSHAVSESGIIILPPPVEIDQEEESLDEDDDLHGSEVSLKWPPKPGMPQSDFFNSEDSWYDAPPEGFSLDLSPFATMWMTLFAWISASSLAFIYRQDESLYEEYLSVNGREYPQKIVLADGRSSEIKQTLAGCLSRALPGLIAYLRLPTPVSTIETGMGRLLETMSFSDALPAFRMKQWQLVVLLFIEALSVSRIPALTPHMTNQRTLFHKVWDGAQITGEEYEVLKDLIIPLGRAPQFSAQSGA